MMQTMMSGMWWGGLLGLILVLGFAYIIWIYASKEKGNTKLIGQVIVIFIVVIVALLFVSSIFLGRTIGMDRYGYGPHMMGRPPRQMEKYMDRMMQDTRMKKYFEEYLKKER